MKKEIEKIEMDQKSMFENTLKSCIKKACKDLYRNDSKLINDSNAHTSERSIAFRFGIYLDKRLSKFKCFHEYTLDAEYNRNLADIKRLPNRPNGCFPDFIIHKRGSKRYNLLVIECKGWWSEKYEDEEDINKIRYFIEDDRYQYQKGLFIKFEKKQAVLTWFSSGN